VNKKAHGFLPPYWKSGAGGFALIIVPSLDLVIYKMDGSNTIRRSPMCRSRH
jgi:hypothetical protein